MSFDGSGSFRFSLSFSDKNIRSVKRIIAEYYTINRKRIAFCIAFKFARLMKLILNFSFHVQCSSDVLMFQYAFQFLRNDRGI